MLIVKMLSIIILIIIVLNVAKLGVVMKPELCRVSLFCVLLCRAKEEWNIWPWVFITSKPVCYQCMMLATTQSGSNEISYKSETIKVGHTFVDTFDEQKFIRQRPGKTVSKWSLILVLISQTKMCGFVQGSLTKGKDSVQSTSLY